MIRTTPALTAGHLERVSRFQDQLLDTIRERTGWHDPTDPRPAAITGAALSCLIAAQATWIASDQARPFDDLLDQAMAALKPG